MKVHNIVETAISVRDPRRSAEFYGAVFGFSPMLEDDRICALDVAPGNVLLLFREGASMEPMALPDGRGVIPPHGSSGEHHFALGIGAADLEPWLARLAAQQIAIDSIVSWPSGGRSIYFRDLDRNLVELMTPGVWPNY